MAVLSLVRSTLQLTEQEVEVDKTCQQCEQTKPAELFYRSKRNKDGRDSYCKECRDGKHAAWYAEQKASRPVPLPITEKACTACGETKPLKDFYASENGRGGKDSRCKVCKDAYWNEYTKRPEVAARLKEQARNRRSGTWTRPPRRLPKAEGFEVCTMCNLDKPVEAFSAHKLGRNGRDAQCKECRTVVRREQRKDPNRWSLEKRRDTARRYGITLAEYDAMVAAHDGKCDICGEGPGEKGFHLDHCHKTGEVRGLLCGKCNVGLGHFRDDPTLLIAATLYLTSKTTIAEAV